MKEHYERMLPGARLWTGGLEVEMEAIEQIRAVTKLPILAGPVADGPGSYAVYSWDGDGENVKLLSELSFNPARKPEALLPLEKSGSELRVLILFDGDKEGAPTPVTVAAP